VPGRMDNDHFFSGLRREGDRVVCGRDGGRVLARVSVSRAQVRAEYMTPIRRVFLSGLSRLLWWPGAEWTRFARPTGALRASVGTACLG